jgi:hypothetical protein
MFHVVQFFHFYSLSNCEYTNNTLAVLFFLILLPRDSVRDGGSMNLCSSTVSGKL